MPVSYSHFKKKILKYIDDMLAVENIPGCPCEELRDKVRLKFLELLRRYREQHGFLLLYLSALSRWSRAAESEQGKGTLEKALKRLNAQNQA